MTPQELKNSILQLAIQGKLVEQRAEECTAAELLRDILTQRRVTAPCGWPQPVGTRPSRAEREPRDAEVGRSPRDRRVSARNGGRGATALPPIPDDEKPFDIPESWEWVRLGEVCEILDSKRRPITKSERTSGPYPYYGASCVQDYVADYIFDEPLVLLGEDGAKWGRGDNSAFRISGKAWVNNHAHVLRPLPEIDHAYLVHTLCILDLRIFVTGTTVPKLNQARMCQILLPLPPLAEQKRIVAKIEELLPLIDRYEKAWSKLEDFNKRFPVDMQKSLLQMAIQGKLVEQRAEEGTGEELYRQIQAERARLIKSGAVKAEKPFDPTISDDEKPFEIPENWTWVRFGNLGSYKKGPFGSALTKSMFVPKGANSVKVYEQKNAIQKDATLGEYYIRRDYFETKMSGFEVHPGDVIVSCAGTIGETYVLPEGIEQGIINQALMRMKIFAPMYIPYFLIFFDVVLKQNARANSKGSAIKNIPPFEILKNYLVPLPPLAEQKRIVAKLEELLPLCERLK